jgi:hypothetical protein
MSDADKTIRYNRLAHAVRCYFAADVGLNVEEQFHWKGQIMKVLGGDDNKCKALPVPYLEHHEALMRLARIRGVVRGYRMWAAIGKASGANTLFADALSRMIWQELGEDDD